MKTVNVTMWELTADEVKALPDDWDIFVYNLLINRPFTVKAKCIKKNMRDYYVYLSVKEPPKEVTI